MRRWRRRPTASRGRSTGLRSEARNDHENALWTEEPADIQLGNPRLWLKHAAASSEARLPPTQADGAPSCETPQPQPPRPW